MNFTRSTFTPCTMQKIVYMFSYPLLRPFPPPNLTNLAVAARPAAARRCWRTVHRETIRTVCDGIVGGSLGERPHSTEILLLLWEIPPGVAIAAIIVVRLFYLESSLMCGPLSNMSDFPVYTSMDRD